MIWFEAVRRPRLLIVFYAVEEPDLAPIENVCYVWARHNPQLWNELVIPGQVFWAENLTVSREAHGRVPSQYQTRDLVGDMIRGVPGHDGWPNGFPPPRGNFQGQPLVVNWNRPLRVNFGRDMVYLASRPDNARRLRLTPLLALGRGAFGNGW